MNEGMLYNVPNEHFAGTYDDIFIACFNWIFLAERDKLVCANGLHWLVREGVRTSWPSANMTKFLDERDELVAKPCVRHSPGRAGRSD